MFFFLWPSGEDLSGDDIAMFFVLLFYLNIEDHNIAPRIIMVIIQINLWSVCKHLMMCVVGSEARLSILTCGCFWFTQNLTYFKGKKVSAYCWLMQYWLVRKGYWFIFLLILNFNLRRWKKGLVISFDFRMSWDTLVNGFNGKTSAAEVHNCNYS